MHNTVPFRPLGARYLVQPEEVKGQETQVGEYVIESQRDIHEKPAEGTVIARGNDCSEVEVGAKVLYGKFSGYEQKLEGRTFVILQESELLGERIVTPFDDEPKLPLIMGNIVD